MNYEDLRRFHRIEKGSPKIVQVPENFYEEIAQLMNSQKKTYLSSNNPDELRVYENIRVIANDLYERREQKIIMKSLRNVRTESLEDHDLTATEKHLFRTITGAIQYARASFFDAQTDNSIDNTKVVLGTEISAVNHEPRLTEPPLIKMTADVPRFVSQDMHEYGPFQANEIVKIPKKEADLLLNRNL